MSARRKPAPLARLLLAGVLLLFLGAACRPHEEPEPPRWWVEGMTQDWRHSPIIEVDRGRVGALKSQGRATLLLDGRGRTLAKATLRRVEGKVVCRSADGTILGEVKSEGERIVGRTPEGALVLSMIPLGLEEQGWRVDGLWAWQAELTTTDEEGASEPVFLLKKRTAFLEETATTTAKLSSPGLPPVFVSELSTGGYEITTDGVITKLVKPAGLEAADVAILSSGLEPAWRLGAAVYLRHLRDLDATLQKAE